VTHLVLEQNVIREKHSLRVFFT